MPTPVIAGVLRCAVIGHTANLQPFVNVLHFGTADESPWGPGDMDALRATLFQLYAVAGGGDVDHGWGYWAAAPATTLELQMTPLDGVSASVPFDFVNIGTPGQDQLPGECALICSHRTGLAGRSHRGRTFWASPYEGTSDTDGSVLASIATDIGDQWGHFRDDLALVDLVHVVASYTNATADPVTGTVCRNYYGHQDRRRR